MVELIKMRKWQRQWQGVFMILFLLSSALSENEVSYKDNDTSKFHFPG